MKQQQDKVSSQKSLLGFLSLSLLLFSLNTASHGGNPTDYRDQFKKDIENVEKFCSDKFLETQRMGNTPALWEVYRKNCVAPWKWSTCYKYHHLAFDHDSYIKTMDQFQHYRTTHIANVNHQLDSRKHITKSDAIKISGELQPIAPHCKLFATEIQNNLKIRQDFINKINAWWMKQK